MPDDDETLHHRWCDRLMRAKFRVKEIRAMIERERQATAITAREIRDKYASPQSRHLLAVSDDELIALAAGVVVPPRVSAQSREQIALLERGTLRGDADDEKQIVNCNGGHNAAASTPHE
jgi:hypothetical protein